MPHSLPLLKRTVTQQEALCEEEDVLRELSYPEKRLDFFYYLVQHRKEVEAMYLSISGFLKVSVK